MSKAEIRKAAVLLLSLPKDEAMRLLCALAPREFEAVAAEIARAQNVTLDEQQSVLCELAGIDAAHSITAPIIDQDDYGVPRLYTGADSRTQPARPPHDDPFAFLGSVACHSLLRLLADESPQTIALVASHVPSVYGAEVISGLAPERQLAVIRAVASQEPTDPEIVRIVARVLEERAGALVA